MKDKIYIESINKYITKKELEELIPKNGECFKINDFHFAKCINSECCQFEYVYFIKNNDIQMGINTEYIPSLDFVNFLLSGEYKKIDCKTYELYSTLITDTYNNLLNQLKNNSIRSAESFLTLCTFIMYIVLKIL